jgi:hypothetical protein
MDRFDTFDDLELYSKTKLTDEGSTQGAILASHSLLC